MLIKTRLYMIINIKFVLFVFCFKFYTLSFTAIYIKKLIFADFCWLELVYGFFGYFLFLMIFCLSLLIFLIIV